MIASAIGLLVLGVAVACGPPSRMEGDANTCPPIDETCPTTAPTYSGDVAPIVMAHCTSCHHPGSTTAPTDLTSYTQVRRQAGTILGELSSCKMPPAPEMPLDPADRAAFLGWLHCGAPND